MTIANKKIVIYISSAVCLLLLLLFFSPEKTTAAFYKWTDERGVIHITDRIDGVPPQFRKEAETRDFKKKREEHTETETPEKLPADEKRSAEEKKEEVKRLEVPFKTSKKGKDVLGRAIVEVRLNNSVTAPLLIDTGARGLLISSKLAYRLGLFEGDEDLLLVPIAGIGGASPALRTIIDTIRIGEAEGEFIPAHIVLEPLSDSYEGLIGMDVMSRYIFTINMSKKLVLLEEDIATKDLPGGHSREWWKEIFQEFDHNKAYWEEQRKAADRAFDKFPILRLKKYKKFAEQQYEESVRFLEKLERQARKYLVPVHWRR